MIEAVPESTYGTFARSVRALEVGECLIVKSGKAPRTLAELSRRVGIKVSSRKMPDRPGYHRVTRIA